MDEEMKASMIKCNDRMVMVPDANGELHEVQLGKPVPFSYIGEDGQMHQGVQVYKEANTGKPGEWWWKVMMSDLIDLLEDISGKQTQALRAILAQFDPHSGIVLVSQEELAKQAHCSLTTVSRVLKLMREHDLIRMPRRGVYTINPQFMSQGGGDRFNALMVNYVHTSDIYLSNGHIDDVIEIEPENGQ